MNAIHFLLILNFAIVLSCTTAVKQNSAAIIAREFFNVYQERADFEKFLNFYADEAILLDITNGDKVMGKKAIASFFAWEAPGYEKKDTVALYIEDQMAQDQMVVTKGHFTPFSWEGNEVEAMHFTTWLYFNNSGKIIKQVDWINYPNDLVDYANRKNSNDWIYKDVK